MKKKNKQKNLTRLNGRFISQEKAKELKRESKKAKLSEIAKGRVRIKGRFVTKEKEKEILVQRAKLSEIAKGRLRISGKFISKSQEIFIKKIVFNIYGSYDQKTAQDFIDRNKGAVGDYLKTEKLITETGEQKAFEMVENYIDIGKTVTIEHNGIKYNGLNALLKLAKFNIESNEIPGYYYSIFKIELIGNDKLYINLNEVQIIKKI